jgi:hypothetical protein
MIYKVFTHQALTVAASIARERGYNRQLSKAALAQFPTRTLFPVQFNMLHEHAAGEAVAPHIRCVIPTDKGMLMLDCDMELFAVLPEYDTKTAQLKEVA